MMQRSLGGIVGRLLLVSLCVHRGEANNGDLHP